MKVFDYFLKIRFLDYFWILGEEKFGVQRRIFRQFFYISFQYIQGSILRICPQESTKLLYEWSPTFDCELRNFWK